MRCPAWRLLGVGNPVFRFPFHQRAGRAARQPALPTLSSSHPGQDWEAEIPEDGCPNNPRGSGGQRGPCLLGQRLQRHHRLLLRQGWPGESGALASPWSRITLGASGSFQQRASIPCVFNLVVCENKYADCSPRKNGLFELALPEKVPEA